jgi:hypothetical protein
MQGEVEDQDKMHVKSTKFKSPCTLPYGDQPTALYAYKYVSIQTEYKKTDVPALNGHEMEL